MAKAMEMVEALDEVADFGDRVTVGDVNTELGHRSTGAFIALPAALELTPIGGIPGVPTALAVIVAIFAVQIGLGRHCMWLPDILSRRRIPADRLAQSADKLRPAADWADQHFGKRATWLVSRRARRLAAGAILLLCLTVPPLELVPFASSIPMGTILLFGLAMILRDGLVMALAWAAFAAAAVGIWVLLPL